MSDEMNNSLEKIVAEMRSYKDLTPEQIDWADRLEALQQQLAAAREELSAASDLLAHRFEQLQAAEADAARYRFLRDPENTIVYAKDVTNWNCVPHGKPYGHFRYDTPEQLDAAIDATLQRGRQP